MSEHDGSFRRLVQTVRERQPVLSGRSGRPPKNRVPTTGTFVAVLHDRMKAIAKERTQQSDHMISVSDVYNEAALELLEDLHHLLGDSMRLPKGALTISGILGLRELIDRPILTPLRDLDLQSDKQQRTTLYVDDLIWNALMDISFQFGQQIRRPIHVHRLIELGAAWYLAGIDSSVMT